MINIKNIFKTKNKTYKYLIVEEAGKMIGNSMTVWKKSSLVESKTVEDAIDIHNNKEKTFYIWGGKPDYQAIVSVSRI